MQDNQHLAAGLEETDCIFCGNRGKIYFLAGDQHLNLVSGIHVSRCNQCHLLFLSPRPNPAARSALFRGIVPESLREYSRETADYSGVNENRRQFFIEKLKLIKRVLKSDLGNNKVLDLGSSKGTFVEEARSNGINAFGVEPSNAGFQSNTVKSPSIIGMAEHLPFPDNSFAVIHANHVFEHFHHPIIAAKECHRVLKKGGLLLLEVPNQLDNIMFHRDAFFRRIPQRKRSIRSIHHLYFFSRKTVALLLERSGFQKVVVKDCYSWKSKGWRLLFSIVTRLAGLFLGGGDRLVAWGFKEGC